MSFLAIPEQYQRSNQPIPLFEVGGVEVAVPLLPADAAEAWAAKAREVDKHNVAISYLGGDLDSAMAARGKAQLNKRASLNKQIDDLIDQIRTEQAARYAIIKRCLGEYAGFDKDLPSKATTPQLTHAFELLRAHNDPFVVTSSLQEATATELLKKLSRKDTASKPSGSGINEMPSENAEPTSETTN